MGLQAMGALKPPSFESHYDPRTQRCLGTAKTNPLKKSIDFRFLLAYIRPR
jgi:hypothetical protein